MVDHHAELDGALIDTDRALKRLARVRARQIRSATERDYFRAIAFSWFRSRRPKIGTALTQEDLELIDVPFRTLLEATEKLASRATYIAALKQAKTTLQQARIRSLSAPPLAASSNDPPDFSPLASDPVMQTILARRWTECRRCIDANAALAATVMMGGLLEALFVARANKLANKTPLFSCSTTPIDLKTKKPLDLRSWTLSPYIDVGHELKWISTSARDVASVLRDYRNYIHPEKERSHGVTISRLDAEMFWELAKSLTRQLLSLQGVNS